LSFLLEREQELVLGTAGKVSSLWQCNGSGWKNVVTQEIVYVKPKECKGALLADDMGLGKTLVREFVHIFFRPLICLRKLCAFLHPP
jgi:SWI/SNF-related matrix-associated actin-dependent regulator of chromatin subfamily A3